MSDTDAQLYPHRNWLAKNWIHERYSDAFRDYLQQEYDLEADDVAEVSLGERNGPFLLGESGWETIMQADADPATAVVSYLGDDRVRDYALRLKDEAAMTDDELERYRELERQRKREEAKRDQRFKLRRYLADQGFEDPALFGFPPGRDGSPYDFDEQDWDELIEDDADIVTYLGEEQVLEDAAAFLDDGTDDAIDDATR